MSNLSSYEQILKEFVDRDDRTVIMTAENRAPMRNLAGLIGNRFIDTGITEQAMVGISAGLALRGRRPVIHALASFLTMRAFEFIRTDLGIPNLPVKVVGFVPGILSDGNGATHQAIEDVSLMRGIPNMRVFAPADEQDLTIGLRTILEDNQPCYIRWHMMKPVVDHQRSFEIGKAEVLSKGMDVQVLTYGALFGEAYQAVEKLKQEGLSVGITNMRMLSPVDENAILDAVQGAKLTVTVEDHFLRGGLATIVAETLTRAKVTGEILNIGFDQQWFRPARLPEVLAYEGLNAEKLTGRIMRKFMELKNAK